MSCVFEGLVCRVPAHTLLNQVRELAPAVAVRNLPACAELCVIEWTAPRITAARDRRLEAFAEKLSLSYGACLLIRFDDRVGLRFAARFEAGSPVATYDSESEIFVETNQDGLPILGAPKLRLRELDPNREYETLRNAIQIALDEIGHSQCWEQLWEIISQHTEG